MSGKWFCEACARATHPECEFEQVTIGGILGGPCYLCRGTSRAYGCFQLKPFDFSLALRFARRGARLTRPGWLCVMIAEDGNHLLRHKKLGATFDTEEEWKPGADDLFAEDWEVYQ